MRTCSDVVGACTVIGHDRAFIVLIVEPTHARSSETTHSIQDLQTIVFKRIQEFNGRLFTHERIHKESHILVVPEGILDRTGVRLSILFMTEKLAEHTNLSRRRVILGSYSYPS